MAWETSPPNSTPPPPPHGCTALGAPTSPTSPIHMMPRGAVIRARAAPATDAARSAPKLPCSGAAHAFGSAPKYQRRRAAGDRLLCARCFPSSACARGGDAQARPRCSPAGCSPARARPLARTRASWRRTCCCGKAGAQRRGAARAGRQARRRGARQEGGHARSRSARCGAARRVRACVRAFTRRPRARRRGLKTTFYFFTFFCFFTRAPPGAPTTGGHGGRWCAVRGGFGV